MPSTGLTSNQRSATGRTIELRANAERVAAALSELMLAAERLAATVDIGAHGLRRAGQGDEFWQYRPAVEGDSAGSIDWRRSARSDSAFVRERERQAPQAAALWVAGTPGMDWTGDPGRATKLERAKLIALALGLVLLRGGERVAIGAADARPGRLQAEALARDLITAPAAALPPPGTLRSQRRLVLIGDFLDDPTPVQRWIAQAGDAGAKGVILQVLDPVEEAYPFDGAVRFRQPDGPVHETRNAAALRDSYLARLAERRALLGQLAGSVGWQFGTHDTASAPSTALLWLAEALQP